MPANSDGSCRAMASRDVGLRKSNNTLVLSPHFFKVALLSCPSGGAQGGGNGDHGNRLARAAPRRSLVWLRRAAGVVQQRPGRAGAGGDDGGADGSWPRDGGAV